MTTTKRGELPVMKQALSAWLYSMALLLPTGAVLASPGSEAIDTHCSSCHQVQNGPHSWSRISQQRKSPEGWDMTVARMQIIDRKSTRLNSSHVRISYAVFCLKKKKQP